MANKQKQKVEAAIITYIYNHFERFNLFSLKESTGIVNMDYYPDRTESGGYDYKFDFADGRFVLVADDEEMGILFNWGKPTAKA